MLDHDGLQSTERPELVGWSRLPYGNESMELRGSAETPPVSAVEPISLRTPVRRPSSSVKSRLYHAARRKAFESIGVSEPTRADLLRTYYVRAVVWEEGPVSDRKYNEIRYTPDVVGVLDVWWDVLAPAVAADVDRIALELGCVSSTDRVAALVACQVPLRDAVGAVSGQGVEVHWSPGWSFANDRMSILRGLAEAAAVRRRISILWMTMPPAPTEVFQLCGDADEELEVLHKMTVLGWDRRREPRDDLNYTEFGYLASGSSLDPRDVWDQVIGVRRDETTIEYIESAAPRMPTPRIAEWLQPDFIRLWALPKWEKVTHDSQGQITLLRSIAIAGGSPYQAAQLLSQIPNLTEQHILSILAAVPSPEFQRGVARGWFGGLKLLDQDGRMRRWPPPGR